MIKGPIMNIIQLRRSNLRILAIDVGVGTQDVLLYDESRTPENNIKLILPAMTQILANKVRNSKNNLIFTGETMGGGPLSFAITNHIKKGYKVAMTSRSAMTIRDDLEEVERLGVEVISEDEIKRYKGREHIETIDIDFEFLKRTLEGIAEHFEFDYMGIAVQDHGHAKHKSDRVFRFEKIREVLQKGVRLYDLGYTKPPGYFSRMNAALRTARRYYDGDIFIMDTKIAAIAGALHDIKERPAISIDVGNGHTLVAVVGSEDDIVAMFEHHTGMLTKEKLEDLVIKLADGRLTNEMVFNDGGHGCYTKEKTGFDKVRKILATGPNRKLLEGSQLNIEFASPIGDVMMTGPMGIVDMIKAMV